MSPYRLRKPAPDELDAFLDRVRDEPFSYPDVGATLPGREPPAGWVVDHNRVELGRGKAAFVAACLALERWAMFDFEWVEMYPPDAKIARGTAVAILARVFGVWVINACRIVATIDERDGPVVRRGFSYGTLPAHAERGEERFLVEWDAGGGGAVSYDILAFSRPNRPLVRLGSPFARAFQRRFAAGSKSAMLRAVSAAIGPSHASTDPGR